MELHLKRKEPHLKGMELPEKGTPPLPILFLILGTL